jgi:hypothetical protein
VQLQKCKLTTKNYGAGGLIGNNTSIRLCHSMFQEVAQLSVAL